MQATLSVFRPVPPPKMSDLAAVNSAGYWSFLYRTVLYARTAAATCALLLCVAIPARGAELPSAPEPHQCVFSAVDSSLAAGVIAGRAGDLISSRQMLARGYHEEILPSPIVHSAESLAAFEGAAAGLEVFSQWQLTRHGHRKLARTMAAVNIAASFAIDHHNFALPAPAHQ